MKEQSPLQKVCMQYGKDCFAIGNTWTLIRFLRANGQHDVANNVEIALTRAKSIARANYFTRRKELQPDWKDWDAQMAEAMAEDDGAYRW